VDGAYKEWKLNLGIASDPL